MEEKTIQRITDEYDAVVQQITDELRSVKSEHEGLKSRLSTVLHENQELTSGVNTFPSHDQRGLVDNLKQQVRTLLNEKEYITKLWQNTAKSVNILEEELKVFQGGTQDFVPKKDLLKMKQRVGDLEEKLVVAERKSREYLRQSETELFSKHQGLELNLENQTGALKIVRNLEDEVLALQQRLQESEKAKSKLQKTLKERDENILSLWRSNVQYRDKVSEAVLVVEAALNEKDAALFREKEARGEIQKIADDLADIKAEAEEKIKREVANVKEEYVRKHENLQVELRKAEDESKMKTLEIERSAARCSLMENQIEKFQKGNFTVDDACASKLLVLEKNLESTFQKLLLSEKQNIQLSSEKQTMKNDIEQMAEHYERTLRTKEIEKQTLHSKISQLQAKVDEVNDDLARVKGKLEVANEERRLGENDWRKEKEEQERLLTNSFTAKMTEVTDNYTEKIKQLQTQLEQKEKLNKKWAQETKIITENLEKLVSSLKLELHKLKRENKRLKAESDDVNRKFEQYKIFLKVISKDVDKLSGMTLNVDEKPS